MTSSSNFVIRMENITKRFPGVIANQGVHLYVRQGSFHAVIGENGAGKSTLLNILYGRYRADSGRIFLHEEEVTNALHSPADAIARGVGLVSQHYALIPALTVWENVLLGAEPTTLGGVINLPQAFQAIQTLANQLGLVGIYLDTPTEQLTVAAQQKVEILKALYRGAKLLLLDEPTATLAPQEADSLFGLLHQLQAQGTTIVFVTHKLREVMAHSEMVTVLRAGHNVGDFPTHETTEQDLLQRMIGSRSHTPARFSPLTHDLPSEPTASPRPHPTSLAEAYTRPTHPFEGEFRERIPTGSPLLQIEGVTVRNARRAEAVQDVSLELAKTEIIGIAGVDGSGQRELAEAIVGLRRLEQGRIFLAGEEMTRRSVRERQQKGLAYIPEDRHRSGMILDFTVAENFLLGHEKDPLWGGGGLLDRPTLLTRAARMIQRYNVRAPYEGESQRAATLSGGNQQKVVIARAMESNPRVLIACQPTRGLDVDASRFVYTTLRQAREQGLGVLLFSLDLDEILTLSDRIAVLFNGRIAGILSRAEATTEAIGALMTGATPTP